MVEFFYVPFRWCLFVFFPPIHVLEGQEGAEFMYRYEGAKNCENSLETLLFPNREVTSIEKIELGMSQLFSLPSLLVIKAILVFSFHFFQRLKS